MTETPNPLMHRDVDEASRRALAQRGLTYRTVPAAEPAFDGWIQAVARGFQDGERSAEQIAGARGRNSDRRLTAVFDESGPMPEVAVGTVASWASELTVPGGTIPAGAISAVTVAQTHRRRGIARALLEGEVRTVAAAGLPVAMLTVTESTLYGRYGFASAASAAILDIDTRRVRWSGPTPEGRLDFVERTVARDVVATLHERTRRRTPGDIALPPGHGDRFTGTDPDAKDGGDIRCVQYRDAAGEVRGILTYTLAPHERDIVKGTAKVTILIAETDDAYAALWRFLLELDLVAHVHAELCSVDEPVLWMIGDRRAASVTVFDHQYLRIVDVPAALRARTYGAAGRVVLRVSDPLEIAAGDYLLTVDDHGAATVSAATDADDAGGTAGAETLELSVVELAAVYLGGVSPETLGRAGRVRGTDLAAASRMFASTLVPRVGLWY
ncbi:GNAT family N-acetyltransferase [Microbacterium arborescens]|uniref:GNAT family N-acetyltransferase n=1 Tax=Microbacterium arborescens TaxID=33883 RepID=UPI0025A2E367|nr:GNAT family N-acetyltransferase [Microbacterium arborescens]WJM14515.1 GNAT family N-acetyltransferase [Microbacterium arborescens]